VKQVTTVDQLSSGRAVLGVGAGHVGDHEADQQDEPRAPSDRFERLEEALQIFRAMFARDPVAFEGRHYRIEAATNRPSPVQPGGPPVLIGGNGEGRTLRLVADFADACNLSGDEASIRRKIAVLENHCAEVGRDPSSITKTMLATVVIAPRDRHASEWLEHLYAKQGPNAAIAPAVIAGSSDEVAQRLANFIGMGIDGLIVNLPDAFDTDNIALVGAAVSRIF
jgi:alkanesulfonate monooxygenase SsuD/methylene tetrahydromethanopterin reductase-like flavin-dependent oxidoreductase (luciferase family)